MTFGEYQEKKNEIKDEIKAIKNKSEVERRKDFLNVFDQFEKAKSVFDGFDDVHPVEYVLALADDDELTNMLESFLKNENEDMSVRLISFFALCTKQRRKKDYSKMETLLNDYKGIFENQNIYKIQSLYFLSTCRNDDARELRRAFRGWAYIDKNYAFMPAFIQIYAETVALCFEHKSDLKIAYSEKETNSILDEAIDRIETAISIRNYPKFHATKARLLYQKEEYADAVEQINEAIDMEDSERKDYAIRINEYEILKAKAEINMATKAKLDELEAIKEEVARSKYDNLSFLGFFSAILALIIGTVSISSSDVLTFTHLMQLLICLGGIISISFGTLCIMIEPRSFIRKTLLMIGIGMALIIISIFILPFCIV